MDLQCMAVFRKVPEGYIAFIEEFPGANTQGASLEEARSSLREAVAMVIEANWEMAREDAAGGAVIREPITVTARSAGTCCGTLHGTAASSCSRAETTPSTSTGRPRRFRPFPGTPRSTGISRERSARTSKCPGLQTAKVSKRPPQARKRRCGSCGKLYVGCPRQETVCLTCAGSSSSMLCWTPIRTRPLLPSEARDRRFWAILRACT